MKRILLSTLISISYLLSSESYIKQNEDANYKIREIVEKHNKSNQLNALKTLNFKQPEIIIPKRDIFEPKIKERKNHIDTDRIFRERKEISKKSKGLSELYEFLSLYGKKPEKNGNLPKEKELYEMLEKGDVKIKSLKRIKNKKSKIAVKNRFQKLNK